MMIRLSHEFGFKIEAFHHTLEAYKMVPRLVEEGIAAATWPDDWVGKAEGYDTSFHAPAWIVEQGGTLVLKSDHPVTVSILVQQRHSCCNRLQLMSLDYRFVHVAFRRTRRS